MNIIHINNLKFDIRQCVVGDYWFCYFLSKRNMLPYVVKHWGGWNPQAYKKGFDKRNVKIVEHKNKRIGFYNLVIAGGYAYLNDIQISKLMRGKGLGTKLLGLIEQEANSKGATKIGLKVFKDNPSKNLYSRLNYKVVKNDSNSFIMEKHLTNFLIRSMLKA